MHLYIYMRLYPYVYFVSLTILGPRESNRVELYLLTVSIIWKISFHRMTNDLSSHSLIYQLKILYSIDLDGQKKHKY
jgi:hypothetical protein